MPKTTLKVIREYEAEITAAMEHPVCPVTNRVCDVHHVPVSRAEADRMMQLFTLQSLRIRLEDAKVDQINQSP